MLFEFNRLIYSLYRPVHTKNYNYYNSLYSFYFVKIGKYVSPFPPLRKLRLFISQFWLFFTELWDINSQLRVRPIKSELRFIKSPDKNSQFWHFLAILRYTLNGELKSRFEGGGQICSQNSQLRVIKAELCDNKLEILREKRSELRVCVKQLWEKKSELWDKKSRLPFFIQWETGFHRKVHAGALMVMNWDHFQNFDLCC